LKAFDVIGLWALIAENARSLTARFAANNTVALPRGLVTALVTEPVAIWNVVHGRSEAVCVVAFIAAIAQQELIFLVAAVTKLTARFHDGLVPSH
jgi:hypothetical protein